MLRCIRSLLIWTNASILIGFLLCIMVWTCKCEIVFAPCAGSGKRRKTTKHILRIDDSVSNMACFVRRVADKAFEKEGGVGVDDAEVNKFIASIQSVATSQGYCVKDHIKDDTSLDTASFEREFNVGLTFCLDSDILLGTSGDKEDTKAAQQQESGAKVDAFAVMMKPKEAQFLVQQPVTESMNLQEQVYAELVGHFAEIKLGYMDTATKKELETMANTVKDVLCFVHKHWPSLFRQEQGMFGNDEYRSCPLLAFLSSCTRKKKNK